MSVPTPAEPQGSGGGASSNARQAGSSVVARRFQHLTRGRDRTLPIEVASLLTQAARSVAYLDLTFSGESAHGTGFLIAPELLLTNYHNVVHESYGEATAITAEFDKQEGFTGVPRIVEGIPSPIGANAGHDWAVIRLREPVDDRVPIALGTRYAITRDDGIIIIQHPLGGYKKFALDALSLKYLDEDFIRYEADTQKGSSGSPVFNTRLHCIALHHSESEVVADEGEDQGTRWSNEGIRIERVMEGLRAANIQFSDKPEEFIARLKAQTRVAHDGGTSLSALSDDPEAFVAKLRALLQEPQSKPPPRTRWHWAVAAITFLGLVAAALLIAVWWSKLPSGPREVLGVAGTIIAAGLALVVTQARAREWLAAAWDSAARSAPLTLLLSAGCAALLLAASAWGIPSLIPQPVSSAATALPPVASGVFNIAITSLVQDSNAMNKELADSIAQSLNGKLRAMNMGALAQASSYPDASVAVGEPMDQWARQHNAHMVIYGYTTVRAGEIDVRPQLWVSRDFGLAEELMGNHALATSFTIPWPPPGGSFNPQLEAGVTLLAQLATGISFLRRESPDEAVRHLQSAADSARSMRLPGDELALFDLFLGSALIKRNQPGDMDAARARFENARAAPGYAARAQIGLANLKFLDGMRACPRDETALLDAVYLYRDACLQALSDDSSAADRARAGAGDCPLVNSAFPDVAASARIGEGQVYEALAWCYKDRGECWQPLMTPAAEQFAEVKRVYESRPELQQVLRDQAALAYQAMGRVQQASGERGSYTNAAEAYVTANSLTRRQEVRDLSVIKLATVCSSSADRHFIGPDRTRWKRACADLPATTTPAANAAPTCAVILCAGHSSTCPATPPPVIVASPGAVNLDVRSK